MRLHPSRLHLSVIVQLRMIGVHLQGRKDSRVARMLMALIVVLAGRICCAGATIEPDSQQGDRCDRLRELVDQQREQSAAAINSYEPQTSGDLGDRNVKPTPILRQLPGVAHVEVKVPAESPQHRIVHLKDWHFVSQELFAADLRFNNNTEIRDEEIERLYEQHLLEVELVQLEQMALLRCLIRHHGLQQVFCEGLAEEDLVIYKAKLRVIRRMRQSISDVRDDLHETERTLQQWSDEGQQDSAEHEQLLARQQQLNSIVTAYRRELLQIGAVGRLLLNEELHEVSPLEDLEIHRRSNPATPDGRIELNREAIEARENAHVKKLLRREGLSLVVLGGGHNLADNVRELVDGNCQYITVETNWHQRFSSASSK